MLATQIAILFFEALAVAAKRSADAGSGGRRHVLSAGALDLTSVQVLQQLVADSLAATQQPESGVQDGQLYTPDPAVLTVSLLVMACCSMLVCCCHGGEYGDGWNGVVYARRDSAWPKHCSPLP